MLLCVLSWLLAVPTARFGVSVLLKKDGISRRLFDGIFLTWLIATVVCVVSFGINVKQDNGFNRWVLSLPLLITELMGIPLIYAAIWNIKRT